MLIVIVIISSVLVILVSIVLGGLLTVNRKIDWDNAVKFGRELERKFPGSVEKLIEEKNKLVNDYNTLLEDHQKIIHSEKCECMVCIKVKDQDC